MRKNNDQPHYNSVALLDANTFVSAACGRGGKAYNLLTSSFLKTASGALAMADITMREAEGVCERTVNQQPFGRLVGSIKGSPMPFLLIETGFLSAWYRSVEATIKELNEYGSLVDSTHREIVQKMPVDIRRLRASCGDRIVAYSALYLRKSVADSVSIVTWDSDFDGIKEDLRTLGIEVYNAREYLNHKKAVAGPEGFEPPV